MGLVAVDLDEEEVESLTVLARSFPAKRVVDPSSGTSIFCPFEASVSPRQRLMRCTEYEPYYDVYLETHPEFSDRAQLELEKKSGKA